jgi:hypothetical protein
MPTRDVQLLPGPVPTASALLATAMASGEAVRSLLSASTAAHLVAADHVRVEREVATWAARAAYAGLALRIVGDLTKREAVRDLGEAIAGVGLGMLKRAHASGRN